MHPSPDPGPTSRPYPIVVGIDFTDADEVTFARAVDVAVSRPGSHLHVLHARPSVALKPGSARALERSASRLEEIPRRLRAYVATLGASAAVPDDLPVTFHAALDAASTALLQLAVDVGAELIVLGTHRQHGVRAMARESVAARVMDEAHCPVLVARPTDYTGLEPSDAIEPLCPDCARTRSETGDDQAWCEFHARPHIQPHAYAWTDVFPIGGHDPGIIPTR